MKEYFDLLNYANKQFKTNNYKIYSSPGRVNLIGEHLDYNGGHVLPCAIDLAIYGAFKRRDDDFVIASSLAFPNEESYTFKLSDYNKRKHWTDYIKGVIKYLNLKNNQGFEVIINSTLPIGAGLSSSASLELLIATYLNEEFNLTFTKETLAFLCKKVENEYIGVNCGIMDQYVISLGSNNHALFLNTENLKYDLVPLNLDNYTLLIANTNKQRTLLDSGYNNRHHESKQILNILKPHFFLNHLCELKTCDLIRAQQYLQNELLFKRLRHIVSENERVLRAKEALINKDYPYLGELFYASHHSLAHDYEVSCFELDTMVSLLQENGALGARMTGAGFGGSVVSLVEKEKLPYLLAKVGRAYQHLTNIKPSFYIANSSKGVSILDYSLMQTLNDLLLYGTDKGLFPISEYHYRANNLINYYNEEQFIKKSSSSRPLEDILEELYYYALNKKIQKGRSFIEKNNFKANIMDLLLLSPSVIKEKFYNNYHFSPSKACNFLYQYSINADYVKLTDVNKNLKWSYLSRYGEFKITINTSKPEKDPLMIKKQAQTPSYDYPKCQLCLENEGFGGNLYKASRRNMRIVPIIFENEEWYFQYSPYQYYQEHSICFSKNHTPMIINEHTFKKLIAFVKLFPHYFVGSNADLAIVGGSILSHEHFQAGLEILPIELAKEEFILTCEGVNIYKLFWPLSTIRIKSNNDQKLQKIASKILANWQNYENKALNIINSKVLHNTITPICRFRENEWIMDLILRNNFTTEERPLGIFHPRPSLHHIKKENIGLIEAMGLAILPGRLKTELTELEELYFKKTKRRLKKSLLKHQDWFNELMKQSSLDIYDEVGKKFQLVLEDAGVFKQDKLGQEAFLVFIKMLEEV